GFGNEKKSPRCADALELADTPLLKNECIRDKVTEGFADLDTVGLPIGFHARRRIDAVAPHVIGKPRIANDARGGGSAIDADPKAQLAFTERRLPANRIAKGKRSEERRVGKSEEHGVRWSVDN